MIRGIAVALLLALAPMSAMAIDFEYKYAHPTKGYVITNDTLSLSSTTITTINNTQNGYWEIQLSPASATYYYRVDGTTSNVTTAGFPVINGTTWAIKGPFPSITFQLGAGGTAQSIRKESVEPVR